MLDLASPKVIFDVHAQSWAHVTADKEYYARLLTWVREQGLVPEHIYRLEVYLIDCPHAQVFEFAYDEQGYKFLACGSDHVSCGDRCEVAKREPYTVILSNLPPDL